MGQIAEFSLLFFTLFIMLIGLLFTLIPPLPGTVIIWLATIFYGVVSGWQKLGWLTISLLSFLMVVGVVIDILAGHFGAKIGGASCLAVTVGTILGLVLGVVGSIIGTPILGCITASLGMGLGILLIEKRRHDDWDVATQALKGYLAGAAVGIMVRVTSGFLMIGIFLVTVYI